MRSPRRASMQRRTECSRMGSLLRCEPAKVLATSAAVLANRATSSPHRADLLQSENVSKWIALARLIDMQEGASLNRIRRSQCQIPFPATTALLPALSMRSAWALLMRLKTNDVTRRCTTFPEQFRIGIRGSADCCYALRSPPNTIRLERCCSGNVNPTSGCATRASMCPEMDVNP